MKKLLIVTAMFLLAGCATVHYQFGSTKLTPEAVASIHKDMTKEQIITTLGAPQSTIKSTADAPETWIYYAHNVQGKAMVLPGYASTSATGQGTTVIVKFSEAGNVSDITVTQHNY